MIKSEYRTKALFPDRNAEKSADWLYCPRCVKGNMYAEYEDESVCLQCGYRHYTRPTTCSSVIKKGPAGQGDEQTTPGN
jgi:ribosomal protein S27AE